MSSRYSIDEMMWAQDKAEQEKIQKAKKEDLQNE